MNKVLLTAFQPFGLKGKISGKNISKEVCDALAKESAGRVDYVLLDVSPTGEAQLSNALASQPRGALLCGEDVSMLNEDVRIEPKAFNPSQQLNLTIPKLLPWGVISVRLPKAKHLSSSFAERAAMAAGCRRISLQQGIGTFWCNRIYYRALEWAQPLGRPVLFLHLGVFGQLDEKISAVRTILDLLIRKSRFDKKAAADFAKSHAADSYEEAKRRGCGQTYCARAVRLAIQAGGINVEPTTYARDCGPKLTAAGFERVYTSDYVPELADVVVFQGISTEKAGHMQIYEGSHWVSDFKQKDKFWPNSDPKSAWQTEKPSYGIFRF